MSSRNSVRIKPILLLGLTVLIFLVPGSNLVRFGWKNLYERPAPNRSSKAPLTEMVPMRDGVRLATDIYFPPNSQPPWPVVLIRTRYNRIPRSPDDYMQGLPKRLIQKDYVYVIQDTRGRYKSGGVDTIYQADGWGKLQDGYDTCAWITKQPWSNGKIGMIGNSAQGILQCLAAPTQPPGLKCLVIGFAPGDFYADWAFPGDVGRSIWREWLKKQEGLWMYGLGLLHYPRDRWWDQFDFIAIADRIRVPALHISGWYDIWTEGTIRRFEAWQKLGGPGARGHQRLLIGPWSHVMKVGVPGCEKLPHESPPFTIYLKTLEFLDYWLKDQKSTLTDKETVAYWELTSPDQCEKGGWRTAANLPQGKSEILYFTEEQGLRKSRPLQEKAVAFRYDPVHPWTTTGGSTLFHTNPGPSEVGPELEKDHHVLFTTKPLEKPLQLTGEIRCVIYAEADVPTSDIAVFLLDRCPDGRYILVIDGIRRVRWSDDAAVELPVTSSGQATAVSIGFMSYTFQAGHAVSLAVSGGNWPRFERNPQNGNIHFHADQSEKANIKIFIGGKQPSHLLLPFIPSP